LSPRGRASATALGLTLAIACSPTDGAGPAGSDPCAAAAEAFPAEQVVRLDETGEVLELVHGMPPTTILVSAPGPVRLIPPAGWMEDAELSFVGCGGEATIDQEPGTRLDILRGRLDLIDLRLRDADLGVWRDSTALLDEVQVECATPLCVSTAEGSSMVLRGGEFTGGGITAHSGGILDMEGTQFIDPGYVPVAVSGDLELMGAPNPDFVSVVEIRDILVRDVEPEGGPDNMGWGMIVQGRSDVLATGVVIEDVLGQGVRVEKNAGEATWSDPDSYRVVFEDLEVSGVRYSPPWSTGLGISIINEGEALLVRPRVRDVQRAGIIVQGLNSNLLALDADVQGVLPSNEGYLGRCVQASRYGMGLFVGGRLADCVGEGATSYEGGHLELEGMDVGPVRANRVENSGIGLRAADGGWLIARDCEVHDLDSFGAHAADQSALDLRGTTVRGAARAGLVGREARVFLREGSTIEANDTWGVVGWSPAGSLQDAWVVVENSTITGAAGAGVHYRGGAEGGKVHVLGSTIAGLGTISMGALEVGGDAIQLVDLDSGVDALVEGNELEAAEGAASVLLSGADAELVTNDYLGDVTVWQQSCVGDPVALENEEAWVAEAATLCTEDRLVSDPTVSLGVPIPSPEEGDLGGS
jgi:hypothetical protein